MALVRVLACILYNKYVPLCSRGDERARSRSIGAREQGGTLTPIALAALRLITNSTWLAPELEVRRDFRPSECDQRTKQSAGRYLASRVHMTSPAEAL